MNARNPQNWRIDLGYDGGAFNGSQRQPGVRTVQSELEAAVARLSGGAEVKLALAGRTDRGVHAAGQVASVRMDWRRGADELRRALHALTPDDVVVWTVAEADLDFHARFSARRREYRYRIWQDIRPPLLLRGSVWHVRDRLDVTRMARAARSVFGSRDFSAVAGDGRGVPGSDWDCERTVFVAEWSTVSQMIDQDSGVGMLLEFRIEADGFLPHMVRNIVGDLVAVGRGDRPVEWVEELLRGRDRRAGAAPAPAHGLVLWRVTYDEGNTGVGDRSGAVDSLGVEDHEDIFSEGV